jgi:hypothetical protein
MINTIENQMKKNLARFGAILLGGSMMLEVGSESIVIGLLGALLIGLYAMDKIREERT